MKICLPIVFLLVLFVKETLGQNNEFDLSGYKSPDLKLSALDFTFSFAGNTISDKSNEINEKFKSTINNLGLYYFLLVNQKNIQKEYTASYSHSLDLQYTSNGVTHRTRQFYFEPQVFGTFINRRYAGVDNFFEYDLNLGYYNTLHRYSTSQPGETPLELTGYNLRNQSLKLSVPLKIGKGRIEPVQDARLAVYILEGLAEINRVYPNTSEEDILQLARFITHLKNESQAFFDLRHVHIFEVETIDSFLVANNYVLNYDGRYLATLSDYWMYGNQQVRLSGQRYSLALVPEYQYKHYIHRNDNSLISDSLSRDKTGLMRLYSGVEYTHEKPVNLAWQNSLYAHFFAGISFNHSFENYNDKRYSYLHAGLFHTVGYYPNTRTAATLGYSLQYLRDIETVSQATGVAYNGNTVKADVTAYVYYYISPQLRLALNYDLFYLYNATDAGLGNYDILFNTFPGMQYMEIPNGLLTGSFSSNYYMKLIYSF